MTVIKANCRDKFTAADFQFICAALQKSTNDEKFLESLFADTDSRDLLLDDERLLHALLERPDYLNVSPHLYFYVLTRHTLRRAGLDDRELTDYVASMLFEFSRSESFKFTSRNHPEPLEHFFEMYSTLEETDTHTAFMVRAYMGNRSLFLSGIFPNTSPPERRGAARRIFPSTNRWAAAAFERRAIIGWPDSITWIWFSIGWRRTSLRRGRR